jgi:hypothetical protein
VTLGGPGPYARLPSFLLGFHGCDRSLAESLFSGATEDLKPSQNDYDWLGAGAYFWENDPVRALSWAESMKGRPRRSGPVITNPAVIGAVIDPGHCLNFLEQSAVRLARVHHDLLIEECRAQGRPLPTNTNPPFMAGSPDKIYRRLDRAVVESIHRSVADNGLRAFDTVRAVFLEGQALYPDAGFLERTHIQLCVRNPRCILGYFRPRF